MQNRTYLLFSFLYIETQSSTIRQKSLINPSRNYLLISLHLGEDKNENMDLQLKLTLNICLILINIKGIILTATFFRFKPFSLFYYPLVDIYKKSYGLKNCWLRNQMILFKFLV